VALSGWGSQWHCGSQWLWLSVAVALSGCGSQWLWLSVAVALSGCGSQRLWLSVAVALSGCGSQWLWLSGCTTNFELVAVVVLLLL
jgi:uncharacterized protein YceK